MYNLDIKEEADKIFSKLSKKNPTQLMIIEKKVNEIRNNPNHHYKFLRSPLNGFNRVHIDGSFVLIFTVDHIQKVVTLYYFDHHDNVYRWRPKGA